MSEMTMEQKDAQIKQLAAELEAHKQFLNEQLQAGVRLRISLVLFQQACHEANVKAEKLTTDNEALTKEVEDLHSRLVALDSQDKEAAA